MLFDCIELDLNLLNSVYMRLMVDPLCLNGSETAFITCISIVDTFSQYLRYILFCKTIDRSNFICRPKLQMEVSLTDTNLTDAMSSAVRPSNQLKKALKQKTKTPEQGESMGLTNGQ